MFRAVPKAINCTFGLSERKYSLGLYASLISIRRHGEEAYGNDMGQDLDWLINIYIIVCGCLGGDHVLKIRNYAIVNKVFSKVFFRQVFVKRLFFKFVLRKFIHNRLNNIKSI